MKKNSIAKLVALLFVSILLLTACNKKTEHNIKPAHQHSANQEYTCPMHPEVIQDKPGNCPICGMELVPRHTPGTETAIDSSLKHLLKPVNEQVISNISVIKPQGGTKIFSMQVQGIITYDTREQTSISSRVSGRIERLLIKYNYQPVKKGQLIMEIYSPDLAAAQRELLFIYQSDANNPMLQKAKERLSLLGMQQKQIQQVLKTGEISYRIPVYSNATGYILDNTATANASAAAPAASPQSSVSDDGMGGMGSSGNAASNNNASTPSASAIMLREGQYIGAGQSLFRIYTNKNLIAEFAFDPSVSPQIKKGQKLVFYEPSDKQTVYTGTIGLIQPVFKEGSNFTIARVYLQDNKFQTGKLVTAAIPIVSKGWWLPQSAVVNLGNKSIVFKKEKDVFVPREVKTKNNADGMVLIDQDISDWDIAGNAAYMIDSESFIKIASENKLKN
ncbi:efflux RND transporter periplasmic adaptor subunit [Flavobacterium piscisymbiosum]|uniref:Efflux RND transporter periplasmic adaptor subunit n=1 Tax=Flavobacterium piscisymbiosum TaxID=2893753 RepID=A0ABS8MKN5_9FLAO|nr:efflux RND transporter periplasmic adaptor subunit [Flavobacterium sp. F-30]MCC9066042.1 efflux RND transporter periplasmic adaptor subunit [Flavobacterium sp. F-30]